MPENNTHILDSLTAKQREVLDLLMEHKSSKEIARELNISPHTVDQRIQFAKEKLGVGSRSEAAVEYRRLVQLRDGLEKRVDDGGSEQNLIETISGGEVPAFRATLEPSDEHAPSFSPPDGQNSKMTEGGSDYRIARGILEGPHGTLVRLGVLVMLTIILLFLALGGVAIFDQLSRSFERYL